MIKVVKNFDRIPTILTQASREEAFSKNIASSSYCDEKNKYKVGSVERQLKKTYHLKCAYCEKKLLDSSKHIEHYRPKSIYYWLAYSWDNLLLCCGGCNSAKGVKFDIKNTRATYQGEPFSNIHELSDTYNKSEIPNIINPEKEDILHLISFDKNGYISSNDLRVSHTITDVCNLNRDELVESRVKIITNFINRINRHYHYFLRTKKLEVFLPDIEVFIADCKVENDFYAFRYFIVHNIEVFFEDNVVLQKILKGLISKHNLS